MILYVCSIRPFCDLFNVIVYFIPYIEKQDEQANQVEDENEDLRLRNMDNGDRPYVSALTW